MLRVVPRMLGIVAVAALAAAAAQLLALAFDVKPLLSVADGDRIASEIEASPSDGLAVIGGGLLVLAGLGLAWYVATHARGRAGTVTTRRRSGRTDIDRRTLADSLERRLERVDQRADVAVRVTRRGRVDLKITTPEPHATGSALLLREELDRLCSTRRLPARSGRITTNVPRRTRGRRRVR